MELNDQIRSFIVENFLFGDEGALASDDQSLMDTGIIDSVGVMELVQYLEVDHGLQIQDEDLMPENLDSIANLAAFIRRKQAAA
jgi:acyl carrier protein